MPTRVYNTCMPNVPPVTDLPPFPRPRSIPVAAALHRFWLQRMRAVPSVDHACACLLSGLELELLRRVVAS